MNNITLIRLSYLLGFVAAGILLATSIYLQFYDGFVPCPLCELQRVAFALLGILFFIGLFLYTNSWGRRLTNIFIFITTLAGAFFAGRQIWLQHFPSANTECGVSLSYMMKVLSFNELLQKIFEGTAECSQSGWTFMSLNMAEWSLICFSLFLCLICYLCLQKKSS